MSCSLETPLLARGQEGFSLSLKHQNPVRNLSLKKWVIFIVLQFRYTFYIPQAKGLRARKCCAPTRIWLADIDLKMANNKVNQGQIGGEEITYIRFIEIPLG